MTSNIGAQYIEKMEKIGFAVDTSTRDMNNYAEAKNKVMSSLKEYFRPEFLNRLDDIIIFDILSPEAIREIVSIQVALVTKRLVEKNIDMVISPQVYDYLAKEGYNPQYGARPLKRLIQNKILTPVANLIIGEQVGKGSTIVVGVNQAILAKLNEKKMEVTDPLAEQLFTFEIKKENRRKNKSEGIVVGQGAEVRG
jgi:ATP-dependent Clp protease ATP-binding subunit ClpA